MIKDLEDDLSKTFGIHFNNHDLLAEAFTQASYVNEHPHQNLKFYERLEFLGDAVVEIVVSEYLFKRYPKMPQGKLTRLRAAMVCEPSFSEFAKECRFDRYIHLGKGEEKAGARQRPSLLCDIFESFIGALYLDQGRDEVERFVKKVIFSKLEEEGRFYGYIDNKTKLQELLQVNGEVDIDYKLLSEETVGSDWKFEVALFVEGEQLATGTGSSKKNAEQKAASDALEMLRSRK